MRTRFHDLFSALRPEQWTKNGVVFAAFVFALGDVNQQVSAARFWVVLLAAICFCAASSCVYLINDIRDRDTDRHHPRKRHRSIAAGRVLPPRAISVSLQLLATALVTGYILAPLFALTLGGYLLLQIAYSFLLKRIAMIDVLVIAGGFVLRAIGGAIVIQVQFSPWLLVCTFLLATFLGLCKRRQELATIPASSLAGVTRESLSVYSEKLLDRLIVIATVATLVSYAVYTLSDATLEKFGDARLGLTFPFVLFGLFRYLYLVYHRELGEQPERVLLTDPPILINVGLYGLAVLVLLLWV